MPKKITKPVTKAKRRVEEDVEEKKITNKEIAYAYIIRHMRGMRANPTVITAIAGAKFRANSNRLQKISDMIAENGAKLTKRLKALLEKRGHADAPFVKISTTTTTEDCDTDGGAE